MQPPFGRQNFLLSGDLFHIPTELPQTLIDGIEPDVALVQFLMQLVLLGQVICYQRPHLKVGQRKAAALEAPDGSVWNLDGKNGLVRRRTPLVSRWGNSGQVSPKVLGVEQFAVKQYPAKAVHGYIDQQWDSICCGKAHAVWQGIQAFLDGVWC